MLRKELVAKLIEFYSRPETKPGITSEGGCRYYIDDNTKCPIGVLLPDPKTLLKQSPIPHLGLVNRLWGLATHDSGYYVLFDSGNGMSDEIKEFTSLLKAQLDEILPSDCEYGVEWLLDIQLVHDELATELLDKYYKDIQREQGTQLKEDKPILYPPYIADFKKKYLAYLESL